VQRGATIAFFIPRRQETKIPPRVDIINQLIDEAMESESKGA
jgi:hypothetical protein